MLDYIDRKLSIGRGPATDTKDIAPSRRLAAHFDELVGQKRENPEMFVVLAEINARSRDPMLSSVVVENDRGSKRFLLEILKEGIRKKEFRARPGPEAAAQAIAAMVRRLSIAPHVYPTSVYPALPPGTDVLTG